MNDIPTKMGFMKFISLVAILAFLLSHHERLCLVLSLTAPSAIILPDHFTTSLHPFLSPFARKECLHIARLGGKLLQHLTSLYLIAWQVSSHVLTLHLT